MGGKPGPAEAKLLRECKKTLENAENDFVEAAEEEDTGEQGS